MKVVHHSKNESDKTESRELAAHFFRTEYGKLVSVITRYIGVDNVQTAEDIVQETLLKAVDSWQQSGMPKNPQAWLYKTAKNLTLNILKRKQHQVKYKSEIVKDTIGLEELNFSNEIILDEQLKMMFACCHPSISENSQIALILKILCGFSISEIANAFFSTNETINKRLVRGRKQLRENNVSLKIPENINTYVAIVHKTIYLLFNEGYSPTQKNELIRLGLCLEAMRLTKILIANPVVKDKADCYALLALMQFNAARFEARMNTDNSIVEMEKQDRSKWNLDLINSGTHNLNAAMNFGNKISVYLILATISANHCIAKSFSDTNWGAILSLYDNLLELEDSPTIRLNRTVALSKVVGNKKAIFELKKLEISSDIGKHYLYHSTIAEFYQQENKIEEAISHFKKAISLTENKRDVKLLRKKLTTLVPKS